MEKKNQSRDSLVLSPGEEQKQDTNQKERNKKRWVKKKDKDRKRKSYCGVVSQVCTRFKEEYSDLVDGTVSESEKQEVKVSKDKKMKKEVSGETGKEESLEIKKQKDTVVTDVILKILETLPSDTKTFLQSVLTLL